MLSNKENSFNYDEIPSFKLAAPPSELEPSELEPSELELDFALIPGGEAAAVTITKASLAFEAATAVVNSRKELDAISEQLAVSDLQIHKHQDAIKQIKAEAQIQIDKLAQAIKKLELDTWDLRKAKRKITEELFSLERQLRQALENEKLRQEYRANAITFDEITNGLSWRTKAFPHQIEGAKLLATAKRAILGDRMGLGKSLTSLIYADMLKSNRLLIIVPDDVASNFVHEVAHWAPHRQNISLAKMTKAQRAQAIKLLSFVQSFTVVINYSAWRRDKTLLSEFEKMRFDTVVIDEAHSIKETTTSAYLGTRQIVMSENSCPECHGPVEAVKLPFQPEDYQLKRDFLRCRTPQDICGWSQNRDIEQNIKRPAYAMCSVKNVLPMTGTVILNKPTDLFAILTLVDPVNFYQRYLFERDYCEVNRYTGKLQFKAGGMESLVRKLSGKYVARDRHTAGVVLPKQTVIVHDIPMDEILYPKQAKVIRDLTKFATIMLSSEKKMSVLAEIALITRKRQANVWPAGIQFKDENGDVVFNVGDEVQESIKLDKICDLNGEGLIPELTADGNMELGERVVVFSQFKTPLVELEARLKEQKISVVRLDGDTPEPIRKEIKLDFDRKFCEEPTYNDGQGPKWQVVLCNYKTGGIGLNFTSATQMICIDEEWNAGKNDQAYGRIDRMGQTEETTVHILRLSKSIDTWMAELIQSKRNMVDGFEQEANITQSLLKSMTDGDIL